jgi:polysaccharide biosynthesis/export protein
MRRISGLFLPIACVLAASIAASGCCSCAAPHLYPAGPCKPGDYPADPAAPRELSMVPHPEYVIESPDILQIDALKTVPKPPYKIAPLDSLVIQVLNIPPEEPIGGLFVVGPDGLVNLGFSYGSVQVSGMTLDEARKAIEDQLLKANLKKPQVRVAIGQIGGIQQIRGEHLVRPDGTVALGKYGSVPVSGLVLDEAKKAIEAQLSRYLQDPEVSVDVAAYNSKTYYVITDGGGYGEQIYRFPTTGKETVLDALSQVYGLPIVACKRRLWLVRPTPAEARRGRGCNCCQGPCPPGEDHEVLEVPPITADGAAGQGCTSCKAGCEGCCKGCCKACSKGCGKGTDGYAVLPIDYKAITRLGATETNYEILPGDRIFVEAEPLIRLDTAMARIISPVERLFGITLLGSGVVHSVAIKLGTPTGG